MGFDWLHPTTAADASANNYNSDRHGNSAGHDVHGSVSDGSATVYVPQSPIVTQLPGNSSMVSLGLQGIVEQKLDRAFMWCRRTPEEAGCPRLIAATCITQSRRRTHVHSWYLPTCEAARPQLALFEKQFLLRNPIACRQSK